MYSLLDHNERKLDINSKRNFRKFALMETKQPSTEGEQAIKEMKKENLKCIKEDNNEDITYQNVMHTMQAVLKVLKYLH